MSNHVLLYGSQCPNCSRFIEALRRTSAAAQVRLVDVADVAPDRLVGVTAVPALILSDGSTLYGTKAFEWLKQFEADMQIDGFAGAAGGMLAFSDLTEEGQYGATSFATSFGPFEPVD